MLLRCILTLLVVAVTASGQTSKKSAAPATAHKATSKAAAPSGPPAAVLHTTAGDLKCELFPDKAPKTVANFIALAKGTKPWKNPLTGKMETKRPLYDGVIFHRTIPEFMIQGGDPTGSGSGDIGYQFDDELLPDLLFDQPGRLAMANRGQNTQSSQFFITEVPRPSLNPCLDPGGCQRPWGHVPEKSGYTIFGQCDAASVELVKQIARKACTKGPVCDNANSKPAEPVKIQHIEILNAGKSAGAKPATRTGNQKTQPKPTTPNR